MCGGNVAFCQIALTTCYVLKPVYKMFIHFVIWMDIIKWNNLRDYIIVVRLWQGWPACKRVCFDERSWSYRQATRSSVLSETVSDSAAHAWQMCPRKRFHVSGFDAVTLCSLLISGIKGVTPLPSGIRWWIKNGWGQWVSFCCWRHAVNFFGSLTPLVGWRDGRLTREETWATYPRSFFSVTSDGR